MDPNKRGNPPFEASSYAAGLERQVVRNRKWIEAAKTMTRDMLDGDGLDKLAAEAWWRQQLDMPQVVLSVADVVKAAATPATDNLKRTSDGTMRPFLSPERYAELRDDDRFLYNEGPDPRT